MTSENKTDGTFMKKLRLFLFCLSSIQSYLIEFCSVKYRFWGQALQKRACGCPEGKDLGLHKKPIFMEFSQLKNVPVHIVPRSGTQNVIQKIKKSSEIESAVRGSPLLQGFPSFRSALRVNASEVVKKCKNRIRVRMRGFAPSIPTPPLKRVRS